jgi:hypothetical protein
LPGFEARHALLDLRHYLIRDVGHGSGIIECRVEFLRRAVVGKRQGQG